MTRKSFANPVMKQVGECACPNCRDTLILNVRGKPRLCSCVTWNRQEGRPYVKAVSHLVYDDVWCVRLENGQRMCPVCRRRSETACKDIIHKDGCYVIETIKRRDQYLNSLKQGGDTND